MFTIFYFISSVFNPINCDTFCGEVRVMPAHWPRMLKYIKEYK